MSAVCANVTSLRLSAAADGGLTILLGLSPGSAGHVAAQLRADLRETGRIVIDFGMPIPVTGNDGVLNRS